jgi:hypothetical protein
MVAPGGYGQFPLAYFDHVMLCVRPTAVVVIGQVVRWTDWGEGTASRDQQQQWFRMPNRELAKKLRVSERAIEVAYAEAESIGYLVQRKIKEPGRGRSAARVEWACVVENFRKGKPRELQRSGNPNAQPSPKRGEAARMPAALTCPKGLECPVDQLVELPDGTLSNRPLLKTKEQGADSPQISSGREKPTSHKSVREDVAIRPRLRAVLERFMVKFGRGPSDAEVLEIQGDLRDAAEEQFEVAAMDAFQRVKSYRYLRPIARECAQTADAWNRQHAAAPSRAERKYPCADCGEMRTWDGGCACKDPTGMSAGKSAS